MGSYNLSKYNSVVALTLAMFLTVHTIVNVHYLDVNESLTKDALLVHMVLN